MIAKAHPTETVGCMIAKDLGVSPEAISQYPASVGKIKKLDLHAT